MTNIIETTANEFNKYSKYITFATVVAATIVSGVVIYQIITKKG